MFSSPKIVETSSRLSLNSVEAKIEQSVMVTDVLSPDELLLTLQVVLELDRVVNLVGEDQLRLEVVAGEEGFGGGKAFIQVRDGEVEASPILFLKIKFSVHLIFFSTLVLIENQSLDGKEIIVYRINTSLITKLSKKHSFPNFNDT
jgi:hypothetical protein